MHPNLSYFETKMIFLWRGARPFHHNPPLRHLWRLSPPRDLTEILNTPLEDVIIRFDRIHERDGGQTDTETPHDG